MASPFRHPSFIMCASRKAVSYAGSSHTFVYDDQSSSSPMSGRTTHSSAPPLRAASTMPPTPRPATIALPAINSSIRASSLLTPNAPGAIRVDLSTKLDSFIHRTSHEPATTDPDLQRMVLGFKDLMWRIEVAAQPGARSITVQDVVREVYSTLRTRLEAAEVKTLREEQKAGLEEAKRRRLARWSEDDKPGPRRVDVLHRRTLFVGIKPEADGSTSDWTICLEDAAE
ncbi:hypothetical protein BDZ89DRAFT_1073986 [Hymenopellis radicata]|nr:hypothetical protein BDZ89DRAFT_1073986 [Hymenopellis radicata]